MIPDIRALNQRIDNLVQITSSASASVVLNNGQFATFTLTTTPDAIGSVIVADSSATLYLTSASTANAFPDGSNIDMSQWQIVGLYNDWGSANADNTNHKAKLYVRNISAGAAQTVILYGQSRLIANSRKNTGALS